MTKVRTSQQIAHQMDYPIFILYFSILDYYNSMLINKGFSNILIISILLILLVVGGYFGYNYFTKATENRLTKSQANIQDKTATISFVNERFYKCGEEGINLSQYYDIELNNKNEGKIIGQISSKDGVYIFKNLIFYTSQNFSTKSFSIYTIGKNFEPVMLRDFKFDGLNEISQILIDDNLVFIVDKNKLYKFNLVNLTDQMVNLTGSFELTTQLKDKEFVLSESRKRTKCEGGYGGIAELFQIWNIDTFKITGTIKNSHIPTKDSSYLDTFKYQETVPLNERVIIYENGVFK